jgi:hypothetical protein
VKNRFQSLPFKCNLQRYDVVLRPLTAADVCGAGARRGGDGVVFTRDTPFLVRNSPQ